MIWLLVLIVVSYIILHVTSNIERKRRRDSELERYRNSFRPSEYPDDSWLRPRGSKK